MKEKINYEQFINFFKKNLTNERKYGIINNVPLEDKPVRTKNFVKSSFQEIWKEKKEYEQIYERFVNI